MRHEIRDGHEMHVRSLMLTCSGQMPCRGNRDPSTTLNLLLHADHIKECDPVEAAGSSYVAGVFSLIRHNPGEADAAFDNARRIFFDFDPVKAHLHVPPTPTTYSRFTPVLCGYLERLQGAHVNFDKVAALFVQQRPITLEAVRLYDF